MWLIRPDGRPDANRACDLREVRRGADRGADARMRAWLSDFRHERYQERFGSHSYTLQKYGLQEAAVPRDSVITSAVIRR